jgi:hypothetical protein
MNVQDYLLGVQNQQWLMRCALTAFFPNADLAYSHYKLLTSPSRHAENIKSAGPISVDSEAVRLQFDQTKTRHD